MKSRNIAIKTKKCIEEYMRPRLVGLFPISFETTLYVQYGHVICRCNNYLWTWDALVRWTMKGAKNPIMTAVSATSKQFRFSSSLASKRSMDINGHNRYLFHLHSPAGGSVFKAAFSLQKGNHRHFTMIDKKCSEWWTILNVKYFQNHFFTAVIP